jgi:NAD(P)-dependent dehydrogenase (short-subunit alcohol dehydrogenase family)
MSPDIITKRGIIGFTRGLANDVANDGIIANAVLPGLTNTLMTTSPTKSKNAVPGNSRRPSGWENLRMSQVSTFFDKR